MRCVFVVKRLKQKLQLNGFSRAPGALELVGVIEGSRRSGGTVTVAAAAKAAEMSSGAGAGEGKKVGKATEEGAVDDRGRGGGLRLEETEEGARTKEQSF